MAFGEIGKIVKNVGSGIFNRTLGRLLGAGISTDSRLVNARAKWSNRVPVVINTFNVELRPGIDYISTKQTQVGDGAGFVDPTLAAAVEEGTSQTWAPTLSNISVLVTPIYSRDSIKNFSMKKFVIGELNGKGNEVGFI